MQGIGSRVAGKKAVLEHLKRSPEQVEVVMIQSNARTLDEVITLCKEKKVKWKQVPKSRLDAETDLAHQGVLARIFPQGFAGAEEILERAPGSELPLILALDQVQDAGNLGVLARTLCALGGAGIVVPKDRSASVGERALKSASGALSTLPLARVPNMARFLRQCQERMFAVYFAGTGPGAHPAYEVSVAWPAVLVLGNEEKGVRPGVAKECRHGLSIPMAGGFDSLNVSQAGAMLLAELLRQHRSAPHQDG